MNKLKHTFFFLFKLYIFHCEQQAGKWNYETWTNLHLNFPLYFSSCWDSFKIELFLGTRLKKKILQNLKPTFITLLGNFCHFNHHFKIFSGTWWTSWRNFLMIFFDGCFRRFSCIVLTFWAIFWQYYGKLS